MCWWCVRTWSLTEWLQLTHSCTYSHTINEHPWSLAKFKRPNHTNPSTTTRQPSTFHPSIIMKPQHHHELNQLHHFHEVPQWNEQKQVAYEIQYNSKLKTKWNRIGLDWIESNGIEMCWGWYESINDESDKMQSVVIHHKCISVKLSEHRRAWQSKSLFYILTLSDSSCPAGTWTSVEMRCY